MVLEKEYALVGATLIDGDGGTPVKDTIDADKSDYKKLDKYKISA